MRAYRVHVALDKYRAFLRRDRRLRLVQQVKVVPFVEYAAFRAVQVLRAVPVEDSPAEADDSPRHVIYREHHPAAETVVTAAVPSRQRQATFDRLFFGYSPASQVSRKRIPRGRGPAYFKTRGVGLRY